MMTFLVAIVMNQTGSNPECLGSQCTRPWVSRSMSLQSSWASYQSEVNTIGYANDADGDGKEDVLDNCRFASNRDQLDGDGDGVGNSCDNCAQQSNFNQLDGDGDGLGDVCDGDLDGDGVLNGMDNCVSLPNPVIGVLQPDRDADGQGDRCDDDVDGDGFANAIDLCPLIPSAMNVPQAGLCSIDTDFDGVNDTLDTCPAVRDATNTDTDRDGLGDACDKDEDNDGVLTIADNCRLVRNRDQADGDYDGVGDLCDAKFCLVVDPADRLNCLDADAPFRVNAGGSVSLNVGERLRLPLFANRNGVAIAYQWTVSQRPATSIAAPTFASGTVTASRTFDYVYPFGEVPQFTSDRPGTYTLQLSATLLFSDPLYPSSTQSISNLTIVAH